ncbi:hypothetical protein LTR66_017496 [Elasticomyces elasticus]|nr:hypothetical protein LTR66_017496 [Elasticomyces elasticus]
MFERMTFGDRIIPVNGMLDAKFGLICYLGGHLSGIENDLSCNRALLRGLAGGKNSQIIPMGYLEEIQQDAYWTQHSGQIDLQIPAYGPSNEWLGLDAPVSTWPEFLFDREIDEDHVPLGPDDPPLHRASVFKSSLRGISKKKKARLLQMPIQVYFDRDRSWKEYLLSDGFRDALRDHDRHEEDTMQAFKDAEEYRQELRRSYLPPAEGQKDLNDHVVRHPPEDAESSNEQGGAKVHVDRGPCEDRKGSNSTASSNELPAYMIHGASTYDALKIQLKDQMQTWRRLNCMEEWQVYNGWSRIAFQREWASRTPDEQRKAEEEFDRESMPELLKRRTEAEARERAEMVAKYDEGQLTRSKQQKPPTVSKHVAEEYYRTHEVDAEDDIEMRSRSTSPIKMSSKFNPYDDQNGLLAWLNTPILEQAGRLTQTHRQRFDLDRAKDMVEERERQRKAKILKYRMLEKVRSAETRPTPQHHRSGLTSPSPGSEEHQNKKIRRIGSVDLTRHRSRDG